MYKCNTCGEIFGSMEYCFSVDGTSRLCPCCGSCAFSPMFISNISYTKPKVEEKSIVLIITKHKNFKNKIYGLGVISAGIASIFISNDATIFVMGLMVGLPILFAKENLFV